MWLFALFLCPCEGFHCLQNKTQTIQHPASSQLILGHLPTSSLLTFEYYSQLTTYMNLPQTLSAYSSSLSLCSFPLTHTHTHTHTRTHIHKHTHTHTHTCLPYNAHVPLFHTPFSGPGLQASVTLIKAYGLFSPVSVCICKLVQITLTS
jgi:hypothetical protein